MNTDCKCQLYVHGMHCASCEILIEKQLNKSPLIKSVTASLTTATISLETHQPLALSQLVDQLNQLVTPHGYRLSHQKESININHQSLLSALVIALTIFGGFIWLQKSGLVENFLNFQTLNLPMVFMIGVIASLSTCMAIVGGLVLTVSSNYSKWSRHRSQPLVMFHLSRIAGFFILGGLMGLIGSAFTLSPMMTFIINLILFTVMVITGINLLEVTSRLRRWQLRLPKFLTSNSINQSSLNSRLAPLLLGVITFFLPCGFTQAMQVYSLTTGNFFSGALTMLTFSLGTLPVLALISIASVKFSQTLKSRLFFQTAGFMIILFGVFNFLGSLAAIGVIPPIFNF